MFNSLKLFSIQYPGTSANPQVTHEVHPLFSKAKLLQKVKTTFSWAKREHLQKVTLKCVLLQGEQYQQQSGDDTYRKEKRLGMGDSWQSGEGDQLHNQVLLLRMVIQWSYDGHTMVI